MLLTEQNTGTIERRVRAAARQRFHRNVDAFFEHGQWWITIQATGAQYSVVDATGGDSINGFDFEQVSEGDEER